MSAAFVASTTSRARTTPPASDTLDAAARTRRTGVPSYSVDPRVERRPPQRAHEQGRLHGRAVREEDARGRRASARAPPAPPRESGTASSGRPTAAAASTARSTARVLRWRRRDHQHPALAQPDVLAARLGERAHARHDPLRRLGKLQRPGVAEQPAAARPSDAQ